jgi:class I fructose-bisphosphate aldolase
MALATKDSALARVEELLGDEADSLLSHRCETIDSSLLHLPGPDFVDRVIAGSDRSNSTLRNFQQILGHGRLGGTGYVSILPVDQGIEHSAGASFAVNPAYFDPNAIVELAIEGGCNAVASTLGVLGSVSRRYAHKIPFIVKINHNELLTYPNKFDQVLFSSVQRAWDLGAVGIGATIYFGSEESTRQLVEIAHCFEEAHRLGMVTVLWCYLRNAAFKQDGVDYDRGRHHQAEDGREQRRLSRTREDHRPRRLRQDVRARLLHADERSSDRPLPLPGRQLLHGSGAADQ